MKHADIAIVNASVLTMDASRPKAEAIALNNGKIVAIGTSSDILPFITASTRTIDAGGQSVLPGFIDSHVHLFQGSAELDFVSVTGLTQIEEVRQKILIYVNEQPNEPLVLGVGANYDLFKNKNNIPRLLLDDIIKDYPFALMAADMHTVWANTMALKKSGLFNGAQVPEGNAIVIGNDGKANGVLLEAGAFGPLLALSRTGGRDMAGYVTGKNPSLEATDSERMSDKALLLRGLEHCAAHGITSLHNMDGNFYQLELLHELEQEERLKCRVQIPFHFKPFDPISRLKEADEMHKQYHSDMVWSGRVKMFMDGVLESRTALMTRPYPDTPNSIGQAIFDQDHFNAACINADRMGHQICVHAIGDLAVKRVLDGYEAARNANGKRDSRHRIEHIELIEPSDIIRMKSLGVVASMQPGHSIFGGFFEPWDAEQVMRTDQFALAFPWRKIRDAGIPLAFSTDWPVMPVSPLANMKSAISPIDLGPLWPDQSQSIIETIESYTSINAWISFREQDYGTIAVGMAADIVILSENLEIIDPKKIADAEVLLTICAGKITYEASLGSTN